MQVRESLGGPGGRRLGHRAMREAAFDGDGPQLRGVHFLLAEACSATLLPLSGDFPCWCEKLVSLRRRRRVHDNPRGRGGLDSGRLRPGRGQRMRAERAAGSGAATRRGCSRDGRARTDPSLASRSALPNCGNTRGAARTVLTFKRLQRERDAAKSPPREHRRDI